MTLAAAAAALVIAAAPDPTLLAALTPTSGGNASAVLDGNAESGWTPTGDPRAEGLLFRFEKNVEIDAIEVQPCRNVTELRLVPAFNAAVGGGITLKATASLPVPPAAARSLRSVFLRIESAKGAGCLAEVAFKRKSQKLEVRPPRSVPGRISTSSVLEPRDAYHPAYLFDGRLDFGWVEGVDGPGAGESVTVDFDQPVTVNAIELWNGYQRSKDHFKKNARAKRITFGTGSKAVTLNVADAMGQQKLALPAPETGTSFTLKVLDAIKGSAYQDLVLSELRFWDSAGPFTLASTDLAQRQEALRKIVATSTLADTTDRLASGACTPGWLRRSLKLRTNNTFVWYEEHDNQEDQTTSEVFDGVWILRTLGSPWSELELFGRRHRVQTTWAPYGDTTEETPDRIGGGKIEITRVSDLGEEKFWALMKEWRGKATKDRVDCVFSESKDFKPEKRFWELAAKGAIVVRGTAISDVLVPQP